MGFLQDHRSAVVPPPNLGQAPIGPENTVITSSSSRSNHNPPSKTYVASPQPLRPLDRKPSSGAPRNRSPSSSTAFSDLAQHGIDIIAHCTKAALTINR